MTLFYMSIDMEKQSLRWVRAGHDPAVVYDPVQDNFEELMGTGLALGVDQNFVFEEYPSFSIMSSQPKGSSQATIRFLIDQA
jgi:serine phosphatase RsbU (regulator of sigma subunit)